MQFEVYIAVADKEPSMSPSDIRKRAGDIITVLPEGAELGWRTLDEYMVVPVSILATININIAREFLGTALFENGLIARRDFRDIIYEADGVSPITYPPESFVWNIQTNVPMARPAKIAKFRHKIELSLLGDIDLVKTQNIRTIYQPFLKVSRLTSMPCFKPGSDFELRNNAGTYETRQIRRFERRIYEEEINGKTIRFIRPNEPAIEVPVTNDAWRPIYCETPTIPSDSEKIWTWSAVQNLVKNKHDDAFINPGEIIG